MVLKINIIELRDDINYILFKHFNAGIDKLKASNDLIYLLWGCNNEITFYYN
jgi:hypothetical protein